MSWSVIRCDWLFTILNKKTKIIWLSCSSGHYPHSFQPQLLWSVHFDVGIESCHDDDGHGDAVAMVMAMMTTKTTKTTMTTMTTMTMTMLTMMMMVMNYPAAAVTKCSLSDVCTDSEVRLASLSHNLDECGIINLCHKQSLRYRQAGLVPGGTVPIVGYWRLHRVRDQAAAEAL